MLRVVSGEPPASTPPRCRGSAPPARRGPPGRAPRGGGRCRPRAAGVRGEEQVPTVRAQGDVLRHVVARREQQRLAAWVSGMEYRCGQPSWGVRKKGDGARLTSSAGWCRRACWAPSRAAWPAPARRGAPLPSPRRPSRWPRAERGAAGPGWSRAPRPAPGRRTKAIRRPSGDQRGLPSRDVVGAIHRIGGVAAVRVDAHERVRAAAGDEGQAAAVRRPAQVAHLPASRTGRLADAEPSIGATHTCRSRSKATSSPRGEITGPSPSPISRGSPPANAIDQTCTFGGRGIPSGFTGRLSSQFAP